MHRLVLVSAAFLFLGAMTFPAVGDPPQDKQEEPKTFRISCKWVHETRVVIGADEKSTLKKNEVAIPDITTLQATLAEYHSGGKLGSTPFGFRLQVEVLPVTATKVRLKVMVEDISAEDGLMRTNSQRVVRQVSLGKMIKLVLDEKANGEGAWAELTVREAPAE